ncbi:MAG: carboxypeptidase regulatory-like domain-containing protein [Acidobacteria bacterium]|nr:carboxypeptidase regulatory-like domain-containing protein [Acidobacteriota bacterium]
MGKKLFLMALSLSILSFGANVFGQGTTSRVTGTVEDNSGGAVAGATVTLTNQGTNSSLTTQTSGSGVYVFDLVQPGDYRVTVEKAGFKKFVSSNNQVLVNQPATINVKLEIGDVSATVNVEGSAELVQTSTSGNVGGTVDQRSLESLPIVGLRGRNPLDLLNFQPGFVVGANTGGGNHVHGSRDRSFNFTLDGIDINESSAGGSNFTPLRPNPDSVQEFQFVSSNFTAELGRSTGAQVTFVTRSGTNRFKGSAFEYYQTPDLNANEYENNLNGLARGQFVQHIFGGSFGGPIIKDKMFFLQTFNFSEPPESRLVTRTVLTPSARQGLFRYVLGGQNAAAGTTTPSVDSNGNVVRPICAAVPVTPCIQTYNINANQATNGNPTTVGLDTTLMAFMNAMPQANNYFVGDGLNTAGFNFAAPQTEKQYDLSFKIDYKFSESNVLYGRYSQGQQDTVCDSVNGGLQAFPDTPCKVTTARNPKGLAINWRWSPRANLTNEFVFGINRFAFSFANPTPNDNYPFIFNIVTDPFDNFTYNARKLRTYQFVDNLTWVKGNHTFKGGLNFRFGRQIDDRSSVSGADITPRVFFGTANNWGTSFITQFAIPAASSTGINANDRSRLLSLINDQLGRLGNVSQAFVADPSNPSQFAAAGSRWGFTHYYPEYDFYFQDSWKAMTNLTLDLGMRWEVKLSPSSDGLPTLRPDGQISYGSTPSNTLRWTEGKLFKNDFDNFSPSIGAAWDPLKDGKTSIRANVRVAYDRLPSQVFANSIFQSAPGNNTGVVNTAFSQAGALLRNGLPSLTPTSSPDVLRTPVALSSNSITVLDADFQYPEVYSWFLGFQRELPGGNLLEVNYIGKRGVHLFGGYDANQVNLGATDPRCPGQTFLSAFVEAQNTATTTNCLMTLLNGTNGTPSTLAAFRSTFSSQLANNSVGAVAQTLAGRTGTTSLTGNGFSPFFLMRYPQFTGGMNVLDSNDKSMYNALEIIIKRRMKAGISFQFSYTYSKSKDTRSFDPTFTTVSRANNQSASSTPFDNNNRSFNYAWSDFDRRDAFQGLYVIELPFGRGRKFGKEIGKGLDYLVGGWQLSGTVNIASGRPFTVYSGSNTFGNVVQSTANCNGCTRYLGVLVQENGTNYWFNSADRAQFSMPAAGSLGNTGRNFFVGPRRFEMDMSISKNIRISERFNFDLRADAKNVFNIKHFGFPTATQNSTTFGRIRDAVNSTARRIQLSVKINF